MKKSKLFSILASSAMALSLMAMPMNVNAASSEAKIANKSFATLEEAVAASENGDTIQITSNVDVSDVCVEFKKNVVLDLNGFEVKSSNTVNHLMVMSGTLTLIDSKGTGKLYSETDYTGKETGYGVLEVNSEKSKLIMNSGLIQTVRSNAANNGQFAITSIEGGNVEINGGKIEAGWYAVAGRGNDVSTKSNIIINGGELVSTADYSIFHPQNGKLTINGGTIYGSAGAIAVKRGTVEVNGGIITSKGQGSTGSWGDGTGSLDNAAINIDGSYGVCDVVISGGEFLAEGDAITVVINPKNKTSLNVSAGAFSSDVSQYVVETSKQITKDNQYIVYPKTTKIELSSSTLNLEVGKTSSLKATLTPSTTLDEVVYTSSDEKVATVDGNGKVTAVDSGNAEITATAGGKTAICVVTVYKVETTTPPTVDTTKPVEEVTVGINDKASQEVISDTTSSVVADIAAGKDVASVDKKTADAVKAAVAEGQTITTEVKVEKVAADKVDEKAKDTIIKLVVEETKDGKTSTVVEYLDLSILLKADDEVLGTVNELNKEVSFTVAIPEELVKDGRVFYVVRVHDGEAEKLPVTMNEDGTITFKTDKFSTYALVYEDAATTTPDTKPTPDPKPTETPKDDKVDTSDNSVAGIYASVCGMALLVGGIVVLKKKKENLMNK